MIWDYMAVASAPTGDGLRTMIASGSLFDVIEQVRVLPKKELVALRVAFPDRYAPPLAMSGTDLVDLLPGWAIEQIRREGDKERAARLG